MERNLSLINFSLSSIATVLFEGAGFGSKKGRYFVDGLSGLVDIGEDF